MTFEQGISVTDNRTMNWMRRNRWQAWWVMGWLLLSVAVANATPWMSGGGALVCSAQGVQWVPASADRHATTSQHATWQCSACLPFVSTPPQTHDLTPVSPAAVGAVATQRVDFAQPNFMRQRARGPPSVVC